MTMPWYFVVLHILFWGYVVISLLLWYSTELGWTNICFLKMAKCHAFVASTYASILYYLGAF